MSDRIRKDYRVYMEPILAFACKEQAIKIGIRTMSRYVRRAVVLALKADGYPLDAATRKFRKIKLLYQGVTCNG